jgi:hypothetical protein
MVGDRQGVTVGLVAETELSLEVDTPEGIGNRSGGQGGSQCPLASPAGLLHQTMAIQNRMNGRMSRNAHIPCQATYQQFPDLAGTPVGLVLLRINDRPFDRDGQLVGIPHGPTGPVLQGDQPFFLVAIEDLVARLPGNPELTAKIRHRLSFKPAGNKAEPLVHFRLFLPWHLNLPPKREVLPMSPVQSVTYVSSRSFRKSKPETAAFRTNSRIPAQYTKIMLWHRQA